MRQVRGTQYEHRGYTWALRRCGKPIERVLAAGEIQPGDRIADVTAGHPPDRTENLERYTYSLYFPPLSFGGGPVIIAKDEVVVAAGTSDCCFTHLFFNALTEAEQKELYHLREAARAARVAGRLAAAVAVAGPAGTIEPWTLPSVASPPEN
jgi:hypothetical protein